MRILISGHGKYGEGVYNTLKFFKNDLENVDVINHSQHFEEDLEHYIRKNEMSDLLVVTDLLGGSINRAAMELLRKYKFHLVTGVNIGFLLEVLFMDQVDSKDILEVVHASKEQVVFVNQMLKERSHD